ncbi:MAG: terminase small subunit, partial [Candidatus Thorarchaeota archaeon]
AAIRAGYAPKNADVQAAQMLKDPEGQKLMEELIYDLNDHLLLEAADVKNEIGKLATSDLRGIFRADGSIKPPHELDDQTAAAIASVKITQDPIKGDVYEYKFHPKMAALDNLTKQFNLHKEHENEGASSLTVVIEGKDADL